MFNFFKHTLFILIFFCEVVLLRKSSNCFLIANCYMHARLFILLLSSWQSSEISARHTAAVGSSFISYFLRLCAVAGALSYSSFPSFSLLPPHLFSIESYTVRYISSDVFSEKFSKELVLLKHAETNVSGFTKVHIIEESGKFQAMASVTAVAGLHLYLAGQQIIYTAPKCTASIDVEGKGLP